MNTRTLTILAASLGLCVTSGNVLAQVTVTNLYSFSSSSGDTNGYHPVAGLVQGSDGNFYGATEEDGLAGNGGTVFRISPSGSLTTLWTFGLGGISDGRQPLAGLVEGSDGNFYGTTSKFGTNGGGGTVFQISTNGSLTPLTILHTFHESGNPLDGSAPEAGLVQGKDSYFYGTTSGSGISSVGTIYRIDSTGSNYTTLHSFTNNPDGAVPTAGLVQGSDGNFYGTTSGGGTNTNAGTVFQFNTNGNLTILHSFGKVNDGQGPLAGLVQGNDGYFYGTTSGGGSGSGVGIVFRISPSGSYSNLYSFTNGADGVPQTGLVLGSDGNFYGTTAGTSGFGTLFRISSSGSYTKLYSFTGGSDGKTPDAGLVQGSDGNFYGTTEFGGTNRDGNVFKLIVPLNPPANQISSIQVADTNVLVTIPSVAGEFYQLQNRNSLTAGSWSNVVGASANSIGGSLTVTNVGGFSQSQQFYRFAITP